MSGRRLDVTATQAVSSMLATLTGAIAASGLGIAGTIIGAAFMSLASTVGTAVYKHYLARSNERLRAAAENLAPRTNGNVVATAIVRHRRASDVTGATTISGATAAGPTAHRPTAADTVVDHGAAGADAAAKAPPAVTAEHSAPGAPPTVVEWIPGETDGTRPPNGATPNGTPNLASPSGASPNGTTPNLASPNGTRPNGTSPNGQAGATGPGSRNGASGRPARPRHSARRTWLMAAAGAVGVFVIAMGGITAFEAIAGQPLESVVWHRSGTGTTFGNAVDNHPARHGQTSRPSGTPTPASSSTAPRSAAPSPTPTPTPSTSASPTATPSSAPSSVPTPSISPTSGGTDAPTPGGTDSTTPGAG
jgi:hypothetical protein